MQLQTKSFPQNTRRRTMWSPKFLEDVVPQRGSQAAPRRDNKNSRLNYLHVSPKFRGVQGVKLWNHEIDSAKHTETTKKQKQICFDIIKQLSNIIKSSQSPLFSTLSLISLKCPKPPCGNVLHVNKDANSNQRRQRKIALRLTGLYIGWPDILFLLLPFALAFSRSNV